MQNNEFRDRVETVEDLNPATLKIIWIRGEQETSEPGGITIGQGEGASPRAMARLPEQVFLECVAPHLKKTPAYSRRRTLRHPRSLPS
ncbi:hypothetical protein CTAM01_02006 [Colletotrichum tamarilloi]|uniref:Uncharacterized protein n=1 Tax=Colletotrichum tamarilloi TaxID=1209934 RepID=A0ABQ9RQ74_9PEZI|nr:uncharacterized protein CTAM01_02006 [Colletotrichum tamarilloi]KAK1509883.1 hypothetical protein CTAM01_02006 [Colletotrichum tamarilloi]